MIDKKPKAVVIGGGNGLSVLLASLKLYTSNITAIVSVGDDGGGSGTIRQDMGILPPGDIRNCITALANDEGEMRQLIEYRFESGMLEGQSFGNLLIAAMYYIKGNFAEAIRAVGDVLKISGRVVPVTLADMRLTAELENGEKVIGESHIPVVADAMASPIARVFIEPENAQAFHHAITAIKEADFIIIGPGSLYTSVIPNLLIKDLNKALAKTTAKKFYCCNIMTQRGESDHFTAADHLEAIMSHVNRPHKIFDYILYNTNLNVSKQIMQRYQSEGAEIVPPGNIGDYAKAFRLIGKPFLTVKEQKIVHDTQSIFKAVYNVLDEEAR